MNICPDWVGFWTVWWYRGAGLRSREQTVRIGLPALAVEMCIRDRSTITVRFFPISIMS